MAAGEYGSDIQLLAGLQGGGSISGASGKRIQNEITNIINRINKNPAGVKLTLSKNGETQLKESIAKAVSSVEIKSFNSTAAINKLKADIQSAMSGVTIPVAGGVSGGSGSSGNSSGGASSKSKGSSSQSKGSFKAQYPEFNIRVSELSSAYSKMVKTSSDTDAVSKKTKEYQELLATINKLRSAGAAANKEEVANAQAKMVNLTNEINKINEVAAAAQRAAKAKETFASAGQINALANKAQSLLNNNPRIANTGYGENLRNALSSLQSGAKLSTEEFNRLKASVLSVEAGIKSAGLQGKTLWSVLKSGYQKFGGWALITKSMMAAANSVRQMITNVTNLDAAMTELRKVTDETESTYEQFFSEATVRARQLGATVTDTINATADFARLGYSIDDAATLADTAIMYKNVGDGITDISVASQSIISTLKGFSLEAEDATHVIDAFNEVGNNFAISSAGIGEALTRSAASLSAANNTMEESIALITAMNTTLQDPEKVGKCLCPAA